MGLQLMKMSIMDSSADCFLSLQLIDYFVWFVKRHKIVKNDQ